MRVTLATWDIRSGNRAYWAQLAISDIHSQKVSSTVLSDSFPLHLPIEQMAINLLTLLCATLF